MTTPTYLDASNFKSGSQTGGLQEALNALPNAAARGGTVLFHGFLQYAQTITVPAGATIQGDGAFASVLSYTGSGDAIKIGDVSLDTRHTTLRGLGIAVSNPSANGVHAIRTKHCLIEHCLFDGHAGSNVAILLDGSTIADTFSAFSTVKHCHIEDQWNVAIRMIGSGVHEASNNDNWFIGNDLQQLNPGTGIGIDMQTGNAWILGGDIEGYATGIHVTGRGSVIMGQIEGCTEFVNFDDAFWGAAQQNFWIAEINRNVPYTDSGSSNIILSPLKLAQMPIFTGA